MWKWIFVVCVSFSTMINAEIKVLVFAGSTRKESVNKKLAAEASSIASQMQAKVTLIQLNDYPVPFYDADLENKEGMPPKAKQFRHLMIQNDVIVIALPEYNGSLPAVLKNSIDWASRSEEGGVSRDAFKGKRFVIMSASPGPNGGIRALAHLRSIIESIGGFVIPQQVSIPDAYNAFDEQNHLKNAHSKKEIEQAIQAAFSPQT